MPSAREPRPATLRRYGLTLEDWLRILEQQGGVCSVCEKLPKSLRLCVDHFHAKNWKKLPPEQRRRYVRGLLCFFCNSYYVGRAITVKKASNVLAYLVAFDERMREM